MTDSPRERDTCANCEKPIHYEADLQSWRHNDDDYDRCRMPGKYFAEPATTSSSEPDNEIRDGLWCACGDIAWVGWAGEGLTPISAGGSVHQPVKPCFYDDLRAATPSPREREPMELEIERLGFARVRTPTRRHPSEP